MELARHSLHDLFLQLGLPCTSDRIDGFIADHGPLPGDVALAEAPFWTASQAAFLRDGIAQDADWAELIDGLDAALRGRRG